MLIRRFLSTLPRLPELASQLKPLLARYEFSHVRRAAHPASPAGSAPGARKHDGLGILAIIQPLRMADILRILRDGPAPGRKQHRNADYASRAAGYSGVLGFSRLSAIRNMRERASGCDRRQ
jgi:hypothetical protein